MRHEPRARTDALKRAPAAFKPAELFEEIFSAIHIMIAYLDPDCNFVRVNRAYAEADGRTPDFFPGKNHFDLYPNAENEEIFRQVVKTGKPHSAYAKPFEYAEHSERGVTFWDWNLQPIKDTADQVTGLILTLVNVTEHQRAQERIAKISDRFLRFGTDPLENINHLTALCGELLGATCALYNRLERGLLCSWGQWHVPPDYNPVSQPEGHLCYDVIRQPSDQLLVVRHLPETAYAQTDPNVRAYQLQTYIGKAVKLGGESVGSLCVVYQRDWMPAEDDRRLMEVIASAIAVEEKRKRAEEALKASEQYARSIIDSSLDMIITVDNARHIVEFNRAAQETFGYTREEVLGKHIDLLYADAIEGRVLHQMTFKDGKATQEIANRRKNGEIFTSAVSAAIMRDEKGALVGVVGVSRDTTERKRADEALRESEKRYRDLFENANDIVYVHDLAGNFTSLNRAAERVSGYTRAEAATMNMSQIVAPEYLEPLRQALAPESLGRGPLIHELEIITKDGRRVPLELSTRLIFKENTPVGVQGIARDITERKQAEAALAQERNLLRTLIDHLPEHVFIQDAESRYILNNAAHLRSLGLSKPEQAIGKRAWDFYPRETAEKCDADDQRVIQSGEALLDREEQFHDRETGAWRWHLTTRVPLRDRQGKVIGLVGMSKDITDRKQEEQKLLYLSTHDILTGLYNRTYFEEEIGRLERGRQFPVSVLMADVDGLKTINDRQGHAAGDESLRQAAQILKTVFRSEDIVARIGGDEFAVLLPCADAVAAENALARVKERLDLYNGASGNNPLSLSLGIATGDKGALLNQILKEADDRMYQDKISKPSHDGLRPTY